jgi:hypothetical protein
MTRRWLPHLPLRLAAGAYILNSGLEKKRADADRAKQLHAFASGAYPPLARLESEAFARNLALAEIALGAALLVPIVPARVAGAALTAFGAGLIGLYLRTPGMHGDDLRPTDAGIPLSKDIWLVAIGLALFVDG